MNVGVSCYRRNGHLFFVGHHFKVDMCRCVGVVFHWVALDILKHETILLDFLICSVELLLIKYYIAWDHCLLCMWIVATIRCQLLIVPYEHTFASFGGEF